MKKDLIFVALIILIVISSFSCIKGKQNDQFVLYEVNSDFQFSGIYLHGNLNSISDLSYTEKKYRNRYVRIYKSYITENDSLEIQYVKLYDKDIIILIEYLYTTSLKDSYTTTRDHLFNVIGNAIVDKMGQYDLINDNVQVKYYSLQENNYLFKIGIPENESNPSYTLSIEIIDTEMIDKYE